MTEEDILAGEPFDCSHDPIALAIHRATGNDSVSVGIVEVWVNPYSDYRKSIRAPLPQEAIDFIRAFDRRKKNQPYPEPFEFELDLPLSKQQEK